MPRDSRRGWLLLLSAYLLVWVPLNFAAEFASVLPSLQVRGGLAISEVAAHGLVAVLSVAAGWALWSGNDDAFRLASLAVTLSTIVAIQSLYWSRLPGQTKPGDEVPLSLLAAAHGFGWLWYLRRRARASR
jgi:hypothetical protein